MVLIQDHRFIPKITSSLPQIKPTSFSNQPKRHFSAPKIQSCSKPINPTSLTLPCSTPNLLTFHENLQTHFGFGLSLALFSFPSPSISAEIVQSSSDKINVEAIIVSIDDFLTQNPFFAPGLAFIWLFVIPIIQISLRKYKAIKAIDAFRKLKEVPEAQLLDIRKEKSVEFIPSPNLKILNKSAVWVEFEEGKEDNFLKKVSESFAEPANTILCILDSFDGESFKLAELLYKNGFKEAYAIKGGVRGKDGWLETQEQYFPLSAHMFKRKTKPATSQQLQINGDATIGPISNINDDRTVSSSTSTSKEQLNNRFP